MVSSAFRYTARRNPSLLSQFQQFRKQAFQAIGHTRDVFSKRSFYSHDWALLTFHS